MLEIREATADDVEAIRDIFRATYGFAYPYSQFYDIDQLTRMVYSDGQVLLVAEDSGTGLVLGTASVILEVGAFSDLVGEFGRLAVHPDARWHGIGGLLMAERLARVRDHLHVGLVEARLAHPYSLRIAESHGFSPIGLMPLKMLVERRESLCLLAQHFGEALALRRNHPRVIPEVHALAVIALEHCGLPGDVIVDDDSSAYHGEGGFALEELTTEGYSTLLRIERGRVRHREIFGPLRLHYGHFKLRSRQSHYLLAKHARRVVGGIGWNEDPIDRTIRIFELIALDDGVTRSLLAGLERACREGGRVSLIEVDVSAHAPRMQRTLLELGFLPAAYVPAMVFTEVEREDIVKMVRLYEEPIFELAPLSRRAQAIADVVLTPFVTQRVLPEIERAVAELPLFRGLDADQVRRLASRCRVVRFAAGDRVIAEGERDDALFIILAGRTEIRRERTAEPLGTVGDGECLGEMSLLSHRPHSASAIAIEPVDAATLGHHDLEALVRMRPDIGVTIFRNLATGLGQKLGRIGTD